MKKLINTIPKGKGKWNLILLVTFFFVLYYANVQAFTLDVQGVNRDGTANTTVIAYRWVVEEDATHRVIPDDPNTNWATDFHKSYMPVVDKGCVGTDCVPETPQTPPSGVTLDDGRYYVSVLPTQPGTYSIGGAPLEGNGNVTVYLNQLPLPTAQISVFVFEDNFPINNAPDLPAERGLEGFKVTVEDAGGRYGMSAGAQMMDAFGNMIGTTYNTDGTVAEMGNGFVLTDATGRATIKNLAPGKYGIQAVPLAGLGWQQTSTIEGTRVIDAWVKANEPSFFSEFGPPGYHVAIGFVNIIPRSDPVNPGDPPGNAVNRGDVLTAGATISGQVVNLHLSRPPDTAFYNGAPLAHTTPWVGLNLGVTGTGRGIYAKPCNSDGTFSIPNVPAGDYQLVVWDSALDIVFAFHTVTVGGADVNLGDVPVFQWFTRLENWVFEDENENGFWDAGEGIFPEQGVNIRWRDGTMYQSMPTDGEGFVPFDQVFPFFSWLVAEVDFARFKATGVTVTVDDGGPIPFGNPWAFGDQLNPQPQFCTDADVLADNFGCATLGAGAPIPNPNTGDNFSRTETGPVLTEAFQGFLGQTSVLQWGKKAYTPADEDNFPFAEKPKDFPGPEDNDWNGNGEWDPAENGGISGMVFYATTRAENDPEQAAAEPWETGIPRVQVNLYVDGDVDNPPLDPEIPFPGSEDIDWNKNKAFDPLDGVIDDLDGDGLLTLADVDNYPFGWKDDLTDPRTGKKDPGPEDIDWNGDGKFDWGDTIQVATTDSWDDDSPAGCQGDPTDLFYDANQDGVGGDCYDGMRNWNQVRPGVFDGGYAFDSYFPRKNKKPDLGNEIAGLPSEGTYIVEAVPPPGYDTVKAQDKNVDFGDEYVPSLLEAALEPLPYPQCVGESYDVPADLSLFPGVTHPFNDPTSPWYVEPLPEHLTATLNDCNRKLVFLQAERNTAADFFLFTEVPIAGHIVGFILDDTANEFDPNSPQFGEKYAPPWLPISIRDWTGREIVRTYSDQYGRYNALVPSTYTANLPQPSGMSPNMLTACMNDPILTDGTEDPNFNPQYSTFCYTFQYMPGTTTYLDTPVVPVAAFAGPDQFPLDCEFPDGTPRIKQVDGGPYVAAADTTITIQSMGTVQVPNPEFDGNGIPPKLIPRDYGFGSVAGTVTIGGVALTNVSWGPTQITGTVAAGTTTDQLVVTRGDNNRSSITGVTVTVGGHTPKRVPTDDYPTIQAAIDSELTLPGDLILVAPGTYDEMVIMWKPVKLQGWGEGSTRIRAINTPAEKLAAWRTKVESLIDPNGDGDPADGLVDLLPAQEVAFGGIEPGSLFTEEGAGIIVLAKNDDSFETNPARIDGFTITGAAIGGGIVVNGYADLLEISNNRIISNSGFFGGGIRVGHPELIDEAPLAYADADNDDIRIHNNHITQNGGLGGAGGGVSLCTGSDNYQVTDNYICGNFNLSDGGGIGHLGLSDNALIARNTILFNDSFNQGNTVSGGGIFIGGQAPLGAGLGSGSGQVTVNANLIQGNAAEAGDGGGIRTSRTNLDTINIFNNMIVNNVAALAGGGISLEDTASTNIIHNTIANNDSTATAGGAFAPGSPNQSTPQPAGIVSRAHSPELAAASGQTFSDPVLKNNIIWHNRSFYFFGDPGVDPPLYQLLPASTLYDDLAVLGTAGQKLSPEYSILTSLTGIRGEDYTDANNLVDAPLFVFEYFNGQRGGTVTPGEPTTALQPTVAFDEGGNSIRVRFGPLTPCDDAVPGNGDPGSCSDYHITAGSPPVNVGGTTNRTLFPALDADFDLQTRPNTTGSIDIGADEL
jgi:hypothetical protein